MILGAVLAGGRSSRFGSDKAEALWGERSLLDHVVARLTSVCSAVIICGRHADTIPSVPDRPTPDLGPLGGLNAALHYAGAAGYDRVIVAPCDTPLLDDELFTALASATGDVFLATMPVIGSWRSAHADLLDAHLRSNDSRSMRGWAEAIGATSLRRPAPPNINYPADLERLANKGSTEIGSLQSDHELLENRRSARPD
jgi:molybdopterin-guanine dinucleotide biosynthesis protein A